MGFDLHEDGAQGAVAEAMFDQLVASSSILQAVTGHPLFTSVPSIDALIGLKHVDAGRERLVKRIKG